MSASSPASPEPVIVSQLRAAGCVFAEEEAVLLTAAASSSSELAELVDRRVTGVPLEHILGWVEFGGLRIEVDPGVFVPRRRTELLVREAAALARPDAVVVDLCCGTGAVGVALAAALDGRIQLHAADIDEAAVGCARRNVETTGGRVYLGDLFEPLPASLEGQVDLLVANAPYVPTDAISMMPPEARFYEAQVALDGGPDGVDIQRGVVAGARRWLAPQGCVLVETSVGQLSATVEAFAHSGFTARVASSDELSATVVIGTHGEVGP